MSESYNDNLIRPAFTPTRLEEERAKDRTKVISVRLNMEEIEKIRDAGRLMQQQKPSSIVKQLMDLGLLSLQHEETRAALRMATENVRKNLRLGIEYADPSFNANVGEDSENL